MHVQMNCVIVDADNTNREELAAFLVRFGAMPVAQFPNVEPLAGVLGKPDGPLLAIVNLDPNPAETLKKIATLPRQFPAVNFFLMSQTVDPNLLMEAMHLGIKEFIPLPMSQEKFTAALERVAQVHGMGKRARIIHVIPTIGGCGSTTDRLQRRRGGLATMGKTVLIDMDLIRGGVASYFDIRCRYTIADVMDAAEKLDKQLLDNALTIHKKSGVAILARPDLPEDTQRVNQSGLVRLLNMLSRVFDYVVVDSLMSISPMYSSLLQGSETNLLVMQLNVPSAKNAERFVGAPAADGDRLGEDLHGRQPLREEGKRHRAGGNREVAGNQGLLAGSQRFQERDRGDQFRRTGRASRAAKRNQHKPGAVGGDVVRQAEPGSSRRVRRAAAAASRME